MWVYRPFRRSDQFACRGDLESVECPQVRPICARLTLGHSGMLLAPARIEVKPDPENVPWQRQAGKRGETNLGGSFPRVRGTVGSRLPNWSSSSKPVHPRVCGERPFDEDRMQATYGSSPRVRGTGAFAPEVFPRDRFIPACAGNGPAPSRCRARPTVHPRVCGERAINPPLVSPTYGSSPRVRGTGRRS